METSWSLNPMRTKFKPEWVYSTYTAISSFLTKPKGVGTYQLQTSPTAKTGGH